MNVGSINKLLFREVTAFPLICEIDQVICSQSCKNCWVINILDLIHLLKAILIFHQLIDIVDILHNTPRLFIDFIIIVALIFIGNQWGVKIFKSEELVAETDQIVIEIDSFLFANKEFLIESFKSIFIIIVDFLKHAQAQFR